MDLMLSRSCLKHFLQVMLIKNLDDSLVNGSMGSVVGFAEPEPDDMAYSNKPASKGPKDASISRQKWPLVEFTGGRTFLAKPETWKVELPNGEIQVSRLQVCVILSSFNLVQPFVLRCP